MDGKTTSVALLGMGLVGAHVFTSDDGKTIRDAIESTKGAPAPADAHKAFIRTGGLLLAVIIATVIATASDGGANLFIAFFVMLWVIWGFNNADKLPQLGNLTTSGNSIWAGTPGIRPANNANASVSGPGQGRF